MVASHEKSKNKRVKTEMSIWIKGGSQAKGKQVKNQKEGKDAGKMLCNRLIVVVEERN